MKNNIEIVGGFFGAIAKGDMETAGNLLSESVVWNQPGNGSISGKKSGKQNVFAHLGRIMELSQGTFAIDHVDFLSANNELVVASIHFIASANGLNLSMKGVDLLKVEDEKITEVWLFSESISEEDNFWTVLNNANS